MRMLLILLLGLILTACGGPEDYGPDEVPPAEPAPIAIVETKPEPTVLNCPKGTNLTYKNFGSAFMFNYCRACHSASLDPVYRAGATPNVNFDSAEDIAIWRAAILNRVSPAPTGARMPPAANVPATEIALVLEWLNCGAPAANR